MEYVRCRLSLPCGTKFCSLVDISSNYSELLQPFKHSLHEYCNSLLLQYWIQSLLRVLCPPLLPAILLEHVPTRVWLVNVAPHLMDVNRCRMKLPCENPRLSAFWANPLSAGSRLMASPASISAYSVSCYNDVTIKSNNCWIGFFSKWDDSWNSLDVGCCSDAN